MRMPSSRQVRPLFLLAALLLVALLVFQTQVARAQEAISTPVKPLPDSLAGGDPDADIERKVALGELAIAKADLCAKLKGKNSRINLGCEKVASVKDAKKVWEKNTESSAWEALSVIDSSKHDGKEVEALVDQIMEDALGSVKIDNGLLKFGKANQAETTGRLIFACGQISGCLKRALNAEERVAVAQFLLSVSPVTAPVALGLKALSDFGMVSVSHKQQDKSATVLVTSLVGKPLSFKLGKGTASIVSLVPGKPNEIKVEFDKKEGVLAKVPVEIEVSNGVKTSFDLHFEAAVSFSTAKLVIREKSTVKKEITIGNHPATFDASVSLEPGQTLEITLTSLAGSASFCPEQAVFGFSSSGNEFQVPAACSDREIRVSITNTLRVAEDLKFQSGAYDLVFIASDDKMSNPTKWKMGKVHLSLSPPPEKKHEPLFTHSLLHESDTTLKALPEIHHVFRQPDRRAPFIVSLVFTGAQIGALLALLIGLLTRGFNPLVILKSVKLMFFTAVLLGTELLFCWYWLGVAGAPNMESLAYKYLPPVMITLYLASKNVFPTSGKKSAQM